MAKRLARKPSTASLTPAATNSAKAIHMAPGVAIAQTTIGTSKMRPSVMRFGILKANPAYGRGPGTSAENAPVSRAEYNGARTIARLAIPTYDPGADEDPSWQKSSADLLTRRPALISML